MDLPHIKYMLCVLENKHYHLRQPNGSDCLALRIMMSSGPSFHFFLNPVLALCHILFVDEYFIVADQDVLRCSGAPSTIDTSVIASHPTLKCRQRKRLRSGMSFLSGVAPFPLSSVLELYHSVFGASSVGCSDGLYLHVPFCVMPLKSAYQTSDEIFNESVRVKTMIFLKICFKSTIA